MRKFIPTDLIEVINNSSGSVSLASDKLSIVWAYPDTVKKIEFGKLEDALNSRGVPILFESGALFIADNEAREALGLDPKTEQELTTKEIENVLRNGSLEDLEDILQLAPEEVFQKIVSISIAMPLNDLAKGTLIKQYTGVDVVELSRDEVIEANSKKAAQNTRQKLSK